MMNEKLQTIINIIESSEKISEQQKEQIAQLLKESEKELTITLFKLDRTERLKRTTAVLLEQTIEELEQKRKSVELQNRELEIEAALERVRTRTMAMQKSEELQDVAHM